MSRFEVAPSYPKRMTAQAAIQRHEEILTDLLERVAELERAGEVGDAPQPKKGRSSV